MGGRRAHTIHHLAIIPDGNRRWARRHRQSVIAGHERGIEHMGDVLKWCRARDIRMVSFWALSSENLHRDRSEVEGLFRAFETRLMRVIHEGDFQKYGVRMRFVGDRSVFPASVQASMARVEAQTAANRKYFVNLLVGYGGRPELIAAVQRLVVDLARQPGRVDESAIASRLWTAGLPEPDLIIRTSGEQRLSGFMPWQSAYSELYFCPSLWPDFSRADLGAAIREFSRRKRRWGK